MEKLLLSLVLFIVAATSVIAQDLSPYHHIIKGIVRKNFKSITEHRYDEVLKGVSNKELEHTFAGDNCLGGTRHDKESLKRWFERVGIVLPDLKFEVTDIQVKGNPAKTLFPYITISFEHFEHLFAGEYMFLTPIVPQS